MLTIQASPVSTDLASTDLVSTYSVSADLTFYVLTRNQFLFDSTHLHILYNVITIDTFNILLLFCWLYRTLYKDTVQYNTVQYNTVQYNRESAVYRGQKK
jgi:hypothetical protein